MASSLYFILPTLGGYTLMSLCLLKNPQILHKKKHAAFHCTNFSHRGGSGERIQNTMEAFTQSYPCIRTLEVTFYAGRYSTGTDRKFTLLEEVFRKFPKMPVNIEIKEENSLLMEKVHLFVCNEDLDIEAAFEAGATGVMTDYPTLLTTYTDTGVKTDSPNLQSNY